MALQGIIYGDLIGSPFMHANTSNRYFDLGQVHRAHYGDRVKSFLPMSTEVSYGCSAVCSWLSRYRDKPTIENLHECLLDTYLRHQKGGWTETTRLSLSSDEKLVSNSPSWGAALRTLPIASFMRKDLDKALELSEACVMATSSDAETIRMGRAVVHAAYLGINGRNRDEIRSVMEDEYGMDFRKDEEDMRAELRGEMRSPLEMMGKVIDGVYHYIRPDTPMPLSPKAVVESAIRAVTGSDSWEDAVRRAVSYGGPSNAVAGLAGGLAESVYGEVSGSIIGKLFAQVPTDLNMVLQIYEKSSEIDINTENGTYKSIRDDVLPIISLGLGKTIYVVPENRIEVRQLIRRTFPNPVIITPEQAKERLDAHKKLRSTGTYVYENIPEEKTLYIQNCSAIVSPTTYVAPGMPPLQQRKIHLREFTNLRQWCIEKQKEMNTYAHNPENCQIHYEGAYHMLVGSRRIDFLMSDQLAGRIRLDDKGLIRVELGEYRDFTLDARFENHGRQAWEIGSLFTIPQTVDPLTNMKGIKDAIESRLLDVGLESGQVSNLDMLSSLDEKDMEYAHFISSGPSNEAADIHENIVTPSEEKQSVKTIYSIGHSYRTEKQFMEMMHSLGVDTIVDIRSVRTSSRSPHFNEENLFESLSANGIEYIIGGEKLGARYYDRNLMGNMGKVDWEKVRRTENYRSGIAAVERFADQGRLVAIMCSEGDPMTCHRLGLVSRDLASDGYDMKHILFNGEIVSQSVIEDRLLQKYTNANRIPSVVNGTYKQQLNEAYRAMNQDYGFKPIYKRNFSKKMKI